MRSLCYGPTLLGSLGCRSTDHSKLIGMARTGKIKIAPLIDQKLPLDKINETFTMQEQRKVIGRVITIP